VIEAHTFFQFAMDQPQMQPCCGGEVVVFSGPAPGKPAANEDAAAIFVTGEGWGTLVVADGMGGMPAGEQASSLAVAELEQALATARLNGSGLRESILNGFEHANRRVQALGVGAGTTMAVVELNGQAARPYHVGDSGILIVGQRGKIKLQTIAHSPVGYAVEAGVMDEQEALNHDQRHIVSNMIGSSDMHIAIGPMVALAPKDTLLIASDGLFDNLSLAEIVDLVRKGPLLEGARRLVAACRARMNEPAAGQPSKPDDLTFILYRRDLKDVD